MTRLHVSPALTFILLAMVVSSARGQKNALYESINRRGDAAWAAALSIWQWAEPGYQEKRSAGLLAGMLEEAGFDVKRGVAGMPTAFTAMFGDEKPIIGLLGEYVLRRD